MTVSELITHLSGLDPNLLVVCYRNYCYTTYEAGYDPLLIEEVTINNWDGKSGDIQILPPQTVCAISPL